MAENQKRGSHPHPSEYQPYQKVWSSSSDPAPGGQYESLPKKTRPVNDGSGSGSGAWADEKRTEVGVEGGEGGGGKQRSEWTVFLDGDKRTGPPVAGDGKEESGK